jgi:regulator of replication initiation timing
MKGTQETVLHISSKERLDNLEARVRELTEAMQGLSDANQTMALQLGSLTLSLQGQIKRNNTLRAELGALVEIVSQGGQISKEAIRQRVLDASAAELKRRVEELIAKGYLVSTEEVAEDSFIVAQQQDRNGNIVSQRLQVLVSSLEPETQQKILSKKAGETVDLGENEPLLYILEIYKDVSEATDSPEEA